MTTLAGDQPEQKQGPGYMPFIDSARGAAIYLALLGHAMGHFTIMLPLLVFTRTATPTFLVIFGIMIEVAYLKKLRRTKGPAQDAAMSTVRQRFVARMITCYLVFFVICLAAFATGKIDFGRLTSAMTYTGNGRFGNILRLYALMFLILLPTIPLLLRYGWRVVMGLAALAWAASFALGAIEAPSNFTLHMMLGYGEGPGPAAFLSLVFIGFGLMIGAALTGRGSYTPVWIVWGAAMLALLWATAQQGPMQLQSNISSGYRGINHPLYYAYGLAAAGVSLLVFRLLWSLKTPDPITRLLAVTGRQTLYLYGVGNIILNLLPRYKGSLPVSLLLAFVFFTVLTLLVLDRTSGKGRVHALTGGIFKTLGGLYDRGLEAVSRTCVALLFPGRQRS